MKYLPSFYSRSAITITSMQFYFIVLRQFFGIMLAALYEVKELKNPSNYPIIYNELEELESKGNDIVEEAFRFSLQFIGKTKTSESLTIEVLKQNIQVNINQS